MDYRNQASNEARKVLNEALKSDKNLAKLQEDFELMKRVLVSMQNRSGDQGLSLSFHPTLNQLL